MKKMNFSLAFVALFLGIGLAFISSSPVKAKSNSLTLSWFQYNGSGSPTDAANYTEITGSPDCSGTTNICSIQATVGTNAKPVITPSLSTEINNALHNHADSANVELQD
ncbi:hypothetical protein [Mucilaginibacter sp.]|uniref:hypothetical protein n=1 Tax=Mucilaginibacter sp. TaxID=1882438 RepID=UPI003D0F4B5C